MHMVKYTIKIILIIMLTINVPLTLSLKLPDALNLTLLNNDYLKAYKEEEKVYISEKERLEKHSSRKWIIQHKINYDRRYVPSQTLFKIFRDTSNNDQLLNLKIKLIGQQYPKKRDDIMFKTIEGYQEVYTMKALLNVHRQNFNIAQINYKIARILADARMSKKNMFSLLKKNLVVEKINLLNCSTSLEQSELFFLNHVGVKAPKTMSKLPINSNLIPKNFDSFETLARKKYPDLMRIKNQPLKLKSSNIPSLPFNKVYVFSFVSLKAFENSFFKLIFGKNFDKKNKWGRSIQFGRNICLHYVKDTKDQFLLILKKTLKKRLRRGLIESINRRNGSSKGSSKGSLSFPKGIDEYYDIKRLRMDKKINNLTAKVEMDLMKNKTLDAWNVYTTNKLMYLIESIIKEKLYKDLINTQLHFLNGFKEYLEVSDKFKIYNDQLSKYLIAEKNYNISFFQIFRITEGLHSIL